VTELTQLIELDRIVADGRCQPRASMDMVTIADYAEAMAAGAVFPPIRCKRNGDRFYIYDGFHRRAAAERTGLREIEVAWEDGTLLDAIEASCAVNADHGLRRSNEDKRKAVRRMFEVMAERRENWSDGEIARKCGVSDRHPAIQEERVRMTPKFSESVPRTGADGRTINVANIGRRPDSREPLEVTVIQREPARLAMVDLGTGEVIAEPRPVAPVDLYTGALPNGGSIRDDHDQADLDAARMRATLFRLAAQFSTGLLALDPYRVADVLRSEDEHHIRTLAADAERWFEAAASGFGAGLRVVGGADRG